MSKCWYCVQSRGDTNRCAWEGERTVSTQSPGGNSWREPNEVCAESGDMERAGEMGIEFRAEKSVSDFSILVEESAIWLASKGRKTG